MAIDFTLPPDVEAVRRRTRELIGGAVRPVEEKSSADAAAEAHRMTVAENVIAAWREPGALQSALGALTL
jgi:hypothetical protein